MTTAEQIIGRAREMADSGVYQSWTAIQNELVRKGFVDAPTALENPTERGRLNILCAMARYQPPR
jgi:hypothetical protein